MRVLGGVSQARSVDRWRGERCVPEPAATMTRGQSLQRQPIRHDAQTSGLTIVCLRCSACLRLTRWEPHAYQPPQMATYPGQPWLMFLGFGSFWVHPKGGPIVCQLTSLLWLPWNLFRKVPKVFISLCSIQKEKEKSHFKL